MYRRGKGRPKKNDSSRNLNVPEVEGAICSAEFFQIYFSTSCSQRLRIPPSFLKNFDGYIPANFTLRTQPEAIWLVEPEKIDADWYFQKGWPQFAQGNSLTQGDFLTFSYDGKSSFKVKVFGTNGCRKISVRDAERLQGNTEASKHEHSRKGVRRQGSSSTKPCDQEFFKVLLPQRLNSKRLLIPPDYIKHFRRTMPERIILKDESGKCWHVSVEERQSGVFIGSTGWQKFVDDKRMGVGDFLVFEYIGLYSYYVKTFGTDGCKRGYLDAEKNDTIRVKIEKEDGVEANVVKRALAFGTEECQRGSPDAEQNALHLDSEKKDEAETNVIKRARMVERNHVLPSPTARTELLTGMNKIRLEDVVMIDDEPDESEQTNGPVKLLEQNVAYETRDDFKNFVDEDPGVHERPCFVSSPIRSTRNKKQQQSDRVQIPNAIIRRQDIRLHPEMVLCDSEGKEWNIKVYQVDDGRWFIGRGWTEFRRQNNMALNNQCKFTFDTVTFSNRIYVQILPPRRENR